MKKKKARKIYLTGVVLLLLLFALTGTVMAADAGSIRVTLKDLLSEYSNRENVEVRLYRVGSVDENAEPSFDQEWEVTEFPQESSKLDELARKIADEIQQQPVTVKKTNGQGVAEFEQVEPGIYLVTIPEENTYGKVTPFLLHLPYYDAANAATEGLKYSVEVQPKASPVESEQPKEPEDSKEQEQPVKKTEGTKKTGDEAAIWYYITLALTAMAVITAIVLRKYLNVGKRYERGGN